MWPVAGASAQCRRMPVEFNKSMDGRNYICLLGVRAVVIMRADVQPIG